MILVLFDSLDRHKGVLFPIWRTVNKTGYVVVTCYEESNRLLSLFRANQHMNSHAI